MTRSLSPAANRPRQAAAAIAAAIAVVLLLAGCGGDKKASGKQPTETTAAGTPDPNAAESNDPGDIPDDQRFVDYTPPSGAFSVKVPEGWSQVEADGVTTFTDKFNSIRIELVPQDTAPTVQSVRDTDVPALEKSTQGFKVGTISTVNRKAGMAIRILYGIDSEPNSVTGKGKRLDVERYNFWKDGSSVILTLSGAKGADNVDPWKKVTDGFAWK